MSQIDTAKANHQKQKLNHPASPGNRAIQYGHAHAQTEQLFKAHQMNAQLEQLARDEGDLPPDEVVANEPTVVSAPPGDWSDVAAEARRTLDTLEDSAKDVGEAALRLARLPLTLAKRWRG